MPCDIASKNVTRSDHQETCCSLSNTMYKMIQVSQQLVEFPRYCNLFQKSHQNSIFNGISPYGTFANNRYRVIQLSKVSAIHLLKVPTPKQALTVGQMGNQIKNTKMYR